MDKKYRIKSIKTHLDLQTDETTAMSLIKSRCSMDKQKLYNNKNKAKKNSKKDDKKFNSQIAKGEISNSLINRTKLLRQNKSLISKTFSKLKPMQYSPLSNQNRQRSKTVPQSKSTNNLSGLSNSLSPKLKNYNQLTTQLNPQLNISQQQIKYQQNKKYPYYVSKSNKMVQTKQKLLQLKHKIKLNNHCPILQSIQDSVNSDKLGFTRKMKLHLYKKGNYDLIRFLQKDQQQLTPNKSSIQKYKTHSLSKQKLLNKQKQQSKQQYLSKQKFKSLLKSKQIQERSGINYKQQQIKKQKQEQIRELKNAISLKYRDQNYIQQQQRIIKMEQIKKKLKTIRKNNLRQYNT